MTYARLQDYAKASDLLDKLVAQRPDYLEAWRLLGEATLLQAQPARAVVAYEKAIALDKNNIQVLTVRGLRGVGLRGGGSCTVGGGTQGVWEGG